MHLGFGSSMSIQMRSTEFFTLPVEELAKHLGALILARIFLLVYGLSWLVIVTVVIIFKLLSIGSKKFGANFQLMFRLLKLLQFVAFIVTIAILYKFLSLTSGDIFVSVLAFLPTGWALLLIGQACRQQVKWLGMWSSVKSLAIAYENLMGLLIFTPIALLAWFSFVSDGSRSDAFQLVGRRTNEWH